MHSSEVVMESNSLYERIVFPVLRLQCSNQRRKCTRAGFAARASYMPRKTECNILVLIAHSTRSAMVVITFRNHSPVNTGYQVLRYRQVIRQLCDPSISLCCCACLPLRSRK